MKQLLILYLLTSIMTSCSVKKDSSNKNLLESLKTMPDQDNDGLSDELERQVGSNPLISDLPKLSIELVKDVSLGGIFRKNEKSENSFLFLKQEFNEIDTQKGGDLNLLKVLRLKVIKNQYNHLRNIKTEKSDVITNEDLRTNILSGWSDDIYYNFLGLIDPLGEIQDNGSGKFLSNFKIKISNAKNVTEVSDISLKSFFHNFENSSEIDIYNHFLLKSNGSKEKYNLEGNESYVPAITYSLIANELKTTDLHSQILLRSEIGIKFSDYNYVSSGTPLNYLETLGKVLDGNAKIIFSDGKSLEVFFASPGITLEKAFSLKGLIFKTNAKGEIYSINGLENTLDYPIDLDNFKIDDIHKGIWSVFGEGDSLKDILKLQGTYVVSYSKGMDLLRASKNWVEVINEKDFQYLNLDNVYEGDELHLAIDSLRITKQVESLEEIVNPVVCHGSACNLYPNPNRGPTCTCTKGCTEVQSSVRTVDENIVINYKNHISWFHFVDEYGVVVTPKSYSYGQHLIFKFDKLNNHLKNKIILKIKNPLELTSHARKGVISGDCNNVSYEHNMFENIFTINGSVKLYGLNKY